VSIGSLNTHLAAAKQLVEEGPGYIEEAEEAGRNLVTASVVVDQDKRHAGRYIPHVVRGFEENFGPY
jgi:hypothetical protein